MLPFYVQETGCRGMVLLPAFVHSDGKNAEVAEAVIYWEQGCVLPAELGIA
ncbi:hypothetical protein [Hymenobacter translucens]|uniref:hypothetical protein n=1 Tax=Hymenobacter translucens TaxID=2886507 RepID=UPI001D0EEB18|nr:hypothetical protein [Hymenobacter translucens]